MPSNPSDQEGPDTVRPSTNQESKEKISPEVSGAAPSSMITDENKEADLLMTQPKVRAGVDSSEVNLTEEAAMLEKHKELQSDVESFNACVDAAIENGLFMTLDKMAQNRGSHFGRFGESKVKTKPVGSNSTTTTTDAAMENGTSHQSLSNPEKSAGLETLQLILGKIQEARIALKLFNQDKALALSKCKRSLSESKQYYASALYSVGRRWTFVNEYAGFVWIWLAGLLVSIFVIYYFDGSTKISNNLHIDVAAVNAVFWGIIGATLRAIWFLKERVDERGFRKSWNIYFLSIPFLGGILGGVVYLIIFAGLVILTGPGTLTTNITASPDIGTTLDAETNPSISAIAIIPFSALAGYNWEWAIGVFNQIGQRFPIKTTTKDISETFKK